jgi:hypothetical protein
MYCGKITDSQADQGSRRNRSTDTQSVASIAALSGCILRGSSPEPFALIGYFEFSDRPRTTAKRFLR